MEDRFVIKHGVVLAYNGRSACVTVPLGVTEVSYGVFSERQSIVNAVFPEGLKKLPYHTFYGCQRLETVWIPDSVTELTENMFYRCISLKSVRIPSHCVVHRTAFDGASEDFTVICDTDSPAKLPSNLKHAAIKGYLERRRRGEKIPRDSDEAYLSYVKGQRAKLLSAFGEYEPLYDCLMSGDMLKLEEAEKLLESVKDPSIKASLIGYVEKNSTPAILLKREKAEERKMMRLFSGMPPTAAEMREVFSFEIADDGTYVITGYRDDGADVSVPSAIGRRRVSAIGRGAFSGGGFLGPIVKKNVTKIKRAVIAEGITHISELAFAYCPDLESVRLPESLRSIGSRAFYGCKSLKEINLPSGLERIGNECFHLTGLDPLVFGRSTLYNGNTLLKVDPDASGILRVRGGTEKIASEALKECRKLNAIVLPKGLREISDGAFGEYLRLECLNIPSSLEKIGDGNFFREGSVDRLEIESVSAWLSVTLEAVGASPTAVARKVTFGGEPLVSLEVPEGTERLGCAQLAGLNTLKSVSLPKSLRSIGEKAFYGCSELTDIKGLEEVKSIGAGSFSGASALKCIRLSTELEYLGVAAISNCFSLRSITLPNTVHALAERLFCGCYTLASVDLPEGLKEIGASAFMNCKTLKTVALPESLEKIGANAFFACFGLEKLRIPERVSEIALSAFMLCTDLTLQVKKGSYAHSYAERFALRHEVY